MIAVGETLVDENIIESDFCCDLAVCKGSCCVSGNGGAPLSAEETAIIEDLFPVVKSYMSEEGIDTINIRGKWEKDEEGDLVTPLIGNKGACAYVHFENGIAKCSFEKAYCDGKSTFQKPISCHLYPIRELQKGAFTALTYHRWGICKPAIQNGRKIKLPLYKFLKFPLERRFGGDWYKELETIAKIWNESKGR